MFVAIMHIYIHTYIYINYCKTRRVSVPLAKLATQVLSLNFVDAKQCGTAHAQSKTSMHGQNSSCGSCSYVVDFFWKAIRKPVPPQCVANQDHHSVSEMQAKIDKYVCKYNDCKVRSAQKC